MAATANAHDVAREITFFIGFPSLSLPAPPWCHENYVPEGPGDSMVQSSRTKHISCQHSETTGYAMVARRKRALNGGTKFRLRQRKEHCFFTTDNPVYSGR